MANKYIITPKLNGKTLTRGVTSAKTAEGVEAKLVYAATRAPKFDTIELTTPDGEKSTLTPAQVRGLGWKGGEPVKVSGKAKKVVKTTKTAKRTRKPVSEDEDGEEGECGHSAKCKGHGVKFCNHAASAKRHETAGKKVGVIDYIVELCREAVDDGGITVEEAVAKLAKKFKDRPEQAMRSTFRCQVGRDLPKKFKFKNQKDGKHTRYAIVNPKSPCPPLPARGSVPTGLLTC